MIIALRWLPAAIALLCATRPLPAQGCATETSRTSLAALSGRQIRELRIVTLAPVALPWPAAIIDRLHMRTLSATVRRQLLFAPGDTVDTLKVAESLRRLRSQRYITDAWLDGRHCAGDDAVDLTLTTRDAQSTRPRLKVGSSSSTLVGIEERNLLGTGREASLYLRADGSRVGAGLLLRDPWVPGTNLSASGRLDSFRDGREWLLSVATRRRSVFDRWHAELEASHSMRGSLAVPEDAFRRQAAVLLVGRRISATPQRVVSLLVGAEAARARLFSAPAAAIVGPSAVRRSFLGLDVGVRRESASYDTVSWLMPGRGLLDVPRGSEGEVIIGVGEDFASRRPMLHVDLWGGRMWLPDRRHLIVGDLWGSGYLQDRQWEAATVRASLALYRQASRGVWVARLAGERLFNPDPDVRTLTTSDPTLAAFSTRSRMAEAALAGSLERTVRLAGLTRSVALEGALFGAGSVRWAPVSPNLDRLHVLVLGAGLRVAPTKAGRGTVRLDVGYPVVRSPELRPRPYLAFSVAPWLGALRHRDGRRER